MAVVPIGGPDRRRMSSRASLPAACASTLTGTLTSTLTSTLPRVPSRVPLQTGVSMAQPPFGHTSFGHTSLHETVEWKDDTLEAFLIAWVGGGGEHLLLLMLPPPGKLLIWFSWPGMAVDVAEKISA